MEMLSIKVIFIKNKINFSNQKNAFNKATVSNKLKNLKNWN